MDRNSHSDDRRNTLMRIIALLFSLAVTVERLSARRRVDSHLFRMLILSQRVALAMTVELLTGLEAPHPDELAPDAFDAAEAITDRHAYLIALSHTYRQFALFLSLILAMRPRAFRGSRSCADIEASWVHATQPKALPAPVGRLVLPAGLRVSIPP